MKELSGRSGCYPWYALIADTCNRAWEAIRYGYV
jgi:hypothetical protein